MLYVSMYAHCLLCVEFKYVDFKVREVISTRLQGMSFFLSSTLLRQHGVSDKDASVRRFLHREAEQYRMDAEVEYYYKL